MEFVIVQSFRRHDVPGWITRCLASVETWAAARGYAYRFVGDELFDRLPEGYRLRTSHSFLLMTDLARLLLARELHAEGFRRVVWIDADVFLFAPERFAIPDGRDFYFCREVWVEQGDTEPEVSDRINNCVCVFDRTSSFLPFHIDACQQLVRDAAGALSPLMVSTRFLTGLDRLIRIPQLRDVGMFGPDLVRELASGGGPLLDLLRQRTANPLHAANLCLSLRNQTIRRRGRPSFVVDDEMFDAAIDALAAYREGYA